MSDKDKEKEKKKKIIRIVRKRPVDPPTLPESLKGEEPVELQKRYTPITPSFPTGATAGKSLKHALNLVRHDGHDYDDLKVRALGLSLTMLSMAECHAEVVNVLSNALMHLQSKVFTTETISALQPAELVGLYKLAYDTMARSSDYVKHTVDKTEWSKLQGEMLEAMSHRKLNVPTVGEDGGVNFGDLAPEELQEQMGLVLDAMAEAKAITRKRLEPGSEFDTIDEIDADTIDMDDVTTVIVEETAE